MGITETRTKEILDFNQETQKWFEENGFQKIEVKSDTYVYLKGLLAIELGKAKNEETQQEEVVVIVTQNSRFLVSAENGELVSIKGEKIENIETLSGELADLNAKSIYDFNQFYNQFYKKGE